VLVVEERRTRFTEADFVVFTPRRLWYNLSSTDSSIRKGNPIVNDNFQMENNNTSTKGQRHEQEVFRDKLEFFPKIFHHPEC